MANKSDFPEAPAGADAKYTEINLQRRLNEALAHIEQLQNTLRLHLAPAMKADCQVLVDFYKAGAANIEAELELHRLTPMIEQWRQKVEGYQKWVTATAGTPGQRRFVQEQDSVRDQLRRLEHREATLQAQIQQWREVDYPQWDKANQEVRGRIAQWKSDHAALVPVEPIIESPGLALSVTENIDLTKLPAKKQDLSNYFDAAQLTDRQRECISLRLEYGLEKTEIARRLGIHRATVDEHLKAAQRKIEKAQANEKHARNKAKSGVT